jgi:hypothetical protein
MSLRGVIERPDKAPLGSIAQVKQQLAEVFPGVTFVYQAEEPDGAKAAWANMSPLLRIWLFFFGVDGRYPNYSGYFTGDQGGMIEFYFEAVEPIRTISATSYGRTGGLDDYFDRLARKSGWVIQYPRY